VWRFWWAGNDRFRFERVPNGSGFVNVRAGAIWWIVDSDGQAHTNDGDPNLTLGMPPEFGLLKTRSLLATALLQVVRDEPVAGRPTAILRAMPRSGAEHWRWWGFWDSSEPLEIPIDLERGVALGSPYFQVDEIGFDEKFPPALFSRPYDEDHPVQREDRPRAMSLEEARATAPFPVLVPPTAAGCRAPC
jgi:hypothetical protein